MIYHDFVEEEGKDEKQGKLLQAFEWLLTSEQKDKVEDRRKTLVRDTKSLLLKALPAIDAEPDAAKTSSAASASSTTLPRELQIAVKSVVGKDFDSKAMSSQEKKKPTRSPGSACGPS